MCFDFSSISMQLLWGILGVVVGAGVIWGAILLIKKIYKSMPSVKYPEVLRTKEVFTVKTDDMWRLRVCRYRQENSAGEPVLLVHGYQVNGHNFTRPKDGCLVDFLVKKGYDCWVVDLRGTRSSYAPYKHNLKTVTFEGHLRKDLPAVIEKIQEVTKSKKVHYVGHSMGGMLLYAYLHDFGGDAIASATTMGAPTGFQGKTGLDLPTRFVASLARVFPKCLGGKLRFFAPMMYKLKWGKSVFPMNFYNVAKGFTSGDVYNIIENPSPGVNRLLIKSMKRKQFLLDNEPIDAAAAIDNAKVPLFAIYAGKDPFVDPVSAQAFFDSLHLKNKRLAIASQANGYAADYGHCDLAFGKDGEKEIFIPIAEWMAAYPCSGKASATPKIYAKEAPAEVPEYQPRAMDNAQRAELISGERFAHLTEAKPAAKKKAAAKKPAAKKPAAKKETAAKKPAAKKPAAKKPAAKKEAAAKKPAAKKPASVEAPAEPAAAPPAPVEAPAAKKPAAKKAAPKKPAAKKSAAGEEPAAQ